jgi:hypothetical protein
MGEVKGEFSYPLLPYLSKKVINPSHLKILAMPLQPSSIYAPLIFVTIIYFIYVDVKLKSVK